MAEIDYIPKADAAAQAWTANFLTVASGSLAQIGLVAGDLAPITVAKTAFDAALSFATAPPNHLRMRHGKRTRLV